MTIAKLLQQNCRRILSHTKLLLAIGVLTTLCSQFAVSQSLADLVVVNAKVVTMDRQHPEAQAIAVNANKISQVGDRQTIAKLIGPSTKVIDANGRVVLPGFIDTHMHPSPVFDEMGPYGQLDLTPEGGVNSLDALLAKIIAKAKVTPKGQAITGRGYNDNLVGGHPPAVVLDQISPDHPVVLTHSSGHRRVVNSRALAAAGITRETADPPGAMIERDEKGDATGIILERVPQISAVTEGLPEPDDQSLQQGYHKEFRKFVAYGITSIADAGASPGKLEIYRDIIQQNMPVRIYAMVRENSFDWLLENRNQSEWQVKHLSLNAIKMFHGNSLSGRTAWLYEPYAHDASYHGVPPARSQEELNRDIKRIHDAGLQVAIHSNGDREIDMVLTAFEQAQLNNPRPAARHRIEHGSVVNQSILERIKSNNVAMAPHSYVLNHGEKMEEYGAARWDWMHTNKSALDMGIAIGGNSDHGVSPPIVMQRIQSMVTRRARGNGKVYGGKQRVSVEEAITIWTMGSAYLQFEENLKGSITPGKLADLIILDRDPFQADPESLQDILVDTTIIGGEVVFERVDGKEIFSW